MEIFHAKSSQIVLTRRLTLIAMVISWLDCSFVFSTFCHASIPYLLFVRLFSIKLKLNVYTERKCIRFCSDSKLYFYHVINATFFLKTKTCSLIFLYIIGNLRHIKRLKMWPLQDVLMQKYKMDKDSAKMMTDFLLPMLRYEPVWKAPLFWMFLSKIKVK